MSANGVSLEGVEYATAVQVLRDSGNTVQLTVRRRIVLPTSPEPQTIRVQISKSRKKDGMYLFIYIYIRTCYLNFKWYAMSYSSSGSDRFCRLKSFVISYQNYAFNILT